MICILYIDDQEKTEQLRTKIEALEEAGMKVISAGTPREALLLLDSAEVQIDIILLDIQMPYDDTYTREETRNGALTGICILRDIRKRRPTVPVIVVTIVPPPDIQDRLVELGVDSVLYKPVPLQDIIEEIEGRVGGTGGCV